MAKFNIINKAESLVGYLLTITDKSPRKTRSDLIPMLRERALLVIEEIVTANRFPVSGSESSKKTRKKRLKHQRKCLTYLRVIETFLEIGTKRDYFTQEQLRVASELCQELYDMIDNWISSDRRRK